MSAQLEILAGIGAKVLASCFGLTNIGSTLVTQMSDNAANKAESLLAWYEAMGVTDAIGDKPIDRFALSAVQSAAKATQAPQDRLERTATAQPAMETKRAGKVPPPTNAPAPALENIETLTELDAAIAAFDGCALKKTAKNTCIFRGATDAKIMLIGEAPGRDEDLQGKPFVGRAGKLLDKMLAAIGLDETSVYITNTIYWRPPGNRTPTTQEIASCRPFLARQIELLAPELIVLLGGAAAKSMLETTEGIMRLRGKWKLYQAKDRDIPVLATLHPAYLLRTPDAKRYAWRDLLAIKTKLEDLNLGPETATS
ncbi:MAG: uracil-DNA glycosylase [Pseudomonadota bacterium]